MQFDLPAYDIARDEATSAFIFVCEHASNYIPASFDSLGLTPSQLNMHIAWDIGAYGTASQLSQLFQATLVSANYSRLLFDCNRDASEPSAIAEVSENIVIPGNVNLDATARQQRIDNIGVAFHQALADTILRKRARNITPIIVSIHSFTPHFLGEDRETEIGVLFKGENALATQLLNQLQARCDYIIRANEPYDANVFGSHTMDVHAISQHLPHVAIELRQDLIADKSGQKHFAELLHNAFSAL